MNNKLIKISALSLMSLLLVGCGGNAAKGKTKITMWTWGDEAETEVFTNLAKRYNEENTDNIYLNFVKRPSNSYYTSLESNLTGRQAPDLFYVGDSMVKRYAKNGYLYDLKELTKNSKIDTNDLWPTLLQRYQFDPNTYQHSSDASIWGLPKDDGPTAIFYNEDALKAQGITIISAKDDDNDGKVTYEGNEYKAIGYDKDAKVFNNKISMTFEELSDISTLLNHSSAIASTHQTKWTFYSTWWFFAGWSVGGDCIQFHETTDPSYNGGYWEFTLADTHHNYRVMEDMSLDGKDYKAGEFVDYYSLPFMETYSETANLISTKKIIELPSIREMFEYWVGLFDSGISPKPEDGNSISLFTNQEVAMYVTGRYNTVDFRKYCKFNWDCAPLPRYKDGIDAGHSGSMCLSMSIKCENKTEAYKVMEFFCGEEGQDALAETGFNVPSLKSVATDPTKNYLSSDLRPYNNEVFLDAAEYQKGGDWTYLADDAWIEIWSPALNGDVLNGDRSIQSLFDQYEDQLNEYLKNYTRK